MQMDAVRLHNVLHTGWQTLVMMGVGWAIARLDLLKPNTTPHQAVSTINMLVMRVCLPALQLLLLGVQTDMRHMENWRLLGAFMLWTAIVQVGAGVWVILMEGGRLDRWGLHALVLAANNTGILGPVVLEAAAGAGSGYIGMLATVCLYFQQLPVSEALMAAGTARSTQHSTHKHDPHSAGQPSDSQGSLSQHHLYLHPSSHESDSEATGLLVTSHNGSASVAVAAPHHVPGPHKPAGSVTQDTAKLDSFLILLIKNPLMWTTGLAALLSAAGSSDWLAPGGPSAITQLTFVHGSLEWLARCSVPLTLLSTGIWMYGRARITDHDNMRLVATYLVLKLYVLPWLMVAVTHVMGIGGRPGLALLLLTCVPVGQTGFVLAERYTCGTEALTAALIAGLLLLLPHLLLVLWVVNKLGLYSDTTLT